LVKTNSYRYKLNPVAEAIGLLIFNPRIVRKVVSLGQACQAEIAYTGGSWQFQA
jgi:hypothetical protein